MSTALVLGSGIVGLWTAEVLSAAGHHVSVVSASEVTNSTSAAAACVLVPFLPGDPTSPSFTRSVGWAKKTLEHMLDTDADGEFLERMPCFEFGLKRVIEYGFEVATLDFLDFSPFELIELEEPIADNDMAVKFECYLCNSIVFLEWLYARLTDLGVTFQTRTIEGLDDIEWDRWDAVFNCMGYQAVFPDDDLYAVLGQSMFVPTPEPVCPTFGLGAGEHAVFAQRRGFHIGAHFVQGATERRPSQVLYESSVEFVQGPYRELCSSVGYEPPDIDLGTVERVNVGLRPFRSSGPRVERDSAFRNLVHNYGHGAHGWTTGYGSAVEAVRLAEFV